MASWTEAVWAAVQRRAAASANGEFTREELIFHELERIRAETGSVGNTPAQTMSRELQELRDDGLVLFVKTGIYSLATATARERDLGKAKVTQRLAELQVRVGQGPFRTALDKRWRACPLTGISDRALLRASHIVAWRACQTEHERVEPLNGLLLSALWDAAFDKGLVTFEDDGQAVFSPKLSADAGRALLAQGTSAIDGLCDGNRSRLASHRYFFDKGEWPTP